MLHCYYFTLLFKEIYTIKSENISVLVCFQKERKLGKMPLSKTVQTISKQNQSFPQG